MLEQLPKSAADLKSRGAALLAAAPRTSQKSKPALIPNNCGRVG